MRCFNPRAPRGARRGQSDRRAGASSFNPRAPRGARHVAGNARAGRARTVSIRARRAARDCTKTAIRTGSRFQSARAARRATITISSPVPSGSFNPRAPRGARRGAGRHADLRRCFNPRAPRGARPFHRHEWPERRAFQSARAARRATWQILFAIRGSCFNPRAPRGARLVMPPSMSCGFRCFNPRAPRGARPRRWRWPRDLRVSIRARRAARDSSNISSSHSAPIKNARANVPERSGNHKSTFLFQMSKNVSRATYSPRAFSPERLFTLGAQQEKTLHITSGPVGSKEGLAP